MHNPGGSTPSASHPARTNRPPNPRPRAIISNREPLRLETAVTQRKQRTAPHSNRENNAVLRPRSRPPYKPPSQISNREPIRLETAVTQRKQTSPDHSNRENNALLRRPSLRRGRGSPPAGVGRRFAGSRRTTNRKSNKKATKTHPLPPTFVAIKKNSAVYFVQLTTNFNLTM